MKFAAAYYLLLIYTMVIIKPLIPAAADRFAHSFAKAWHVSTVHATEGSDHMEKKMAADANAGSNKNQNADKTEQATHEMAFDCMFYFADPYPFRYNYPFTNDSLSNIYIAYTTPPPRLVV